MSALVTLAPDAALPARDLLLDSDAVAHHLSRVSGPDGCTSQIRGATLVRVKYRIGESLRVVYRVDLPDGDQLVSARVFRGGASLAAYDKARHGAMPAGSLRPVTHDSELDTVWWAFPNDRRLRGVTDLFVEPNLAGIDGWLTSAVVEYAPERSVTVRAVGAASRCVGYVKLYAPGTVDVAALAARHEAAAGAVRVPAVLGRGLAVLGLEALEGRPWVDLATHGEQAMALRCFGEAIARFHGVPAQSGTPHFGRLEPRRVRHAAELVAAACPHVAERALRCAALLASGPGPPEPPVLLHGDCHPDNALVHDGNLALIDLDQAALGSPSADIGSMVALLHARQARGELDRDQTAALAEAFLGGYASERPLPTSASLRWHTAAALVAERAVRGVNRVNWPTIACLDELLARSLELLEGRP